MFMFSRDPTERNNNGDDVIEITPSSASGIGIPSDTGDFLAGLVDQRIIRHLREYSKIVDSKINQLTQDVNNLRNMVIQLVQRIQYLENTLGSSEKFIGEIVRQGVEASVYGIARAQFDTLVMELRQASRDIVERVKITIETKLEESIEKTLGEVRKSVNQLNDFMKKFESVNLIDLAELARNYKDIETRVTKLEEEVTNLTTIINKLAEKIDSIANDLAIIKNHVEKLREDVEALRT